VVRRAHPHLVNSRQELFQQSHSINWTRYRATGYARTGEKGSLALLCRDRVFQLHEGPWFESA
jgi:hypothetical protein